MIRLALTRLDLFKNARFAYVAVVALSVGCASVSPEAADISTITDGGVSATLDCQRLGQVVGNAGVWGGSAGLDAAFADAKNQAATFPGATSILVTHSRMNPTAKVHANVFDCSNRKTQKIEITNPSALSSAPAQQTEAKEEILRKARACQERTGVWVNDQCILEIE